MSFFHDVSASSNFFCFLASLSALSPSSPQSMFLSHSTWVTGIRARAPPSTSGTESPDSPPLGPDVGAESAAAERRGGKLRVDMWISEEWG